MPGFAAEVERLQGEGKTLLRLTATKPLPVRQMRFEGKLVPDIEAVPGAVRVGGRILGETFEETITLRSLTGRPLPALRFEAEGDGLTIESLAENGQYRIRQKASQVGTQTNQVRFHGDSAGRPVTLTVPVSYTGLPVQ